MMVVMVGPRGVGQVTLLVSERTSCRNLNGLKAIVDVIRVGETIFRVLRNPNSPLAPSPLLKDEPASGLDCSGDFKAAPEIRLSGPAAGGGYVLRAGPKVKAGGNRSLGDRLKAGSRLGLKMQRPCCLGWSDSTLSSPPEFAELTAIDQ